MGNPGLPAVPYLLEWGENRLSFDVNLTNTMEVWITAISFDYKLVYIPMRNLFQ